MPMINITAALTSPMLADSFSVIRRTQTVGSNGRATMAQQTISNLSGPVYPSDDNDLKRLADEQITGKAITVITRFALYGEVEVAGTQYQPDIVVWRGDNFLVKHLEDWSNYGPGFVLAICTSIDVVDQPPATE
jgi:hypothetical protein